MIDPGTLLGLLGSVTGSKSSTDDIFGRLLDMASSGGDDVDPEELSEIKEEVADLANTWKALELELEERRKVLASRSDVRDELVANANKSHTDFLEALRRRKQREADLPQ